MSRELCTLAALSFVSLAACNAILGNDSRHLAADATTGGAGDSNVTSGTSGSGTRPSGGASGGSNIGEAGAIESGGSGAGEPSSGQGGSTAGSSSTAGAGALTVSSVFPADHATGVPLMQTGVRARFSEDLDASSVTNRSLTLETSAGAVAGVAAPSGNDLEFTPARALEVGTAYTATLGTDFTSTSGAHLPASYTWSFTTSRVDSEAPVATTTNGAVEPHIAVDPAGNAMAIWCDKKFSVWTTRYVRSLGQWTPSEAIDSTGADAVSPPRFVLDKSGNATVVWSIHTPLLRSNIWGTHYDAKTDTWDAANVIETNDTGDAIGPVIGQDAHGNAMALWNQADASNAYSLWSNRYVAGTGWSTPKHVETAVIGASATYDVAVDGPGNATAVWVDSQTVLWSVLTANASTWSTGSLLHSATTPKQPHIVANATGDAMVVWIEMVGGHDQVWSARLAGGTWQKPIAISNGAADASAPRIAMDDQDDAIAVWNQTGTTGGIWANAYLAASGWQGPKNTAGQDPAIAISPNGHAAIASLNATSVFANDGPVDASASTAWGPPLRVRYTLQSASQPDVGTNDNGDGFAVWVESDGRAWANRFR